MPKNPLALASLALALSISSAPLVRAATGVFGGYIVLSLNGGTNQFYKLENPADTVTPTFTGTNLGTFNPSAGNSLFYKGGEADTFKNNNDNVTAAFSNYRVYLTGSPTGSFITLSLPFNANINGNGDQIWQAQSGNGNLLLGLPVGNYTIETYVNADTNQGARFLNAGGTNYAATFTVVPEPAASTIATAFGALALGLLTWPRLRRHA